MKEEQEEMEVEMEVEEEQGKKRPLAYSAYDRKFGLLSIVLIFVVSSVCVCHRCVTSVPWFSISTA